MSRRHTFVTIAFEGDADLMLLQARSMALYCDPALVNAIVLIDNFEGGAPLEWLSWIRQLYGPLAQKLQVIERDACTQTKALRGWVAQQALKLGVSSQISDDRYVLLDAKNHLVRPLLPDYLEIGGRPRINGYPYHAHPLRDRLEHTCAYVGIDTASAIEKFTRTSTPFVMITEAARRLVDQVEAQEGAPIGEVLRRENITEFFLYAARLKAVGALDAIYDWNQPHGAQLWPGDATDDPKVEAICQRALNAGEAPFFATHRGALSRLTEAGARMVANLWRDRGLVDTERDGLHLISRHHG